MSVIVILEPLTGLLVNVTDELVRLILEPLVPRPIDIEPPPRLTMFIEPPLQVPPLTQVGTVVPDSVPLLLLPEESAAVVRLPSLNFQ